MHSAHQIAAEDKPQIPRRFSQVCRNVQTISSVRFHPSPFDFEQSPVTILRPARGLHSTPLPATASHPFESIHHQD